MQNIVCHVKNVGLFFKAHRKLLRSLKPGREKKKMA